MCCYFFVIVFWMVIFFLILIFRLLKFSVLKFLLLIRVLNRVFIFVISVIGYFLKVLIKELRFFGLVISILCVLILKSIR